MNNKYFKNSLECLIISFNPQPYFKLYNNFFKDRKLKFQV